MSVDIIDIFDPRHLNESVDKVVTVEPFILSNFFSTVVNTSADKVTIPRSVRTSKLAKFANKGQRPHLIGKSVSEVLTVEIPRTFESKIFDIDEILRMRPYNSTFTPTSQIASAINNNVLGEVDDLKERVAYLREFMACQILATGKLEVTTGDVKFSIDFGYTNNVHKSTLGDSAKWTASTAEIENDFHKAKQLISKQGFQCSDVVLGEDAAKAFRTNPEVRAALHNNNLAIGRMDLTKEYGKYGTFLGQFEGINVWEYTQTYKADNGTSTLLIPTDRAIFAAKQNKNVLYKAPIYRIKNNKPEQVSSDLYLNPIVNENETALEWQLEQKSLPSILDNGFVHSMDVL